MKRALLLLAGLAVAGCGGAKDRAKTPETQAADARFHLPFPAGTPTEVAQGFNGHVSHKNKQRYAIDFKVPVGTPISAVRGGVVKRVKSDSNKRCGNKRCAKDGNFIEIDHGDATFTRYYHLRKDGALVKVGDQVCTGQPIGYSGNTGFSNGPHLHLIWVDLLGYSKPMRFHEYAPTEGLPVARLKVRSAQPPPRCGTPIAPSTCPTHQFAHMGAVLAPGTPCSLVKVPSTHRIRGHLLGGPGRVAIVSKRDGKWTYRCYRTDRAGRFDVTARFHPVPTDGYSYLMVGRAKRPTGHCSVVQGWDESPKISFLDWTPEKKPEPKPEPDEDTPKTAGVLGVLKGSGIGILKADPGGLVNVLGDIDKAARDSMKKKPKKAPEKKKAPRK